MVVTTINGCVSFANEPYVCSALSAKEPYANSVLVFVLWSGGVATTMSGLPQKAASLLQKSPMCVPTCVGLFPQKRHKRALRK